MKKPELPPVRLGYEVGSGHEVLIPVRHMCVTGQTQEAGKTTALEALIARSGLRAVTFITKRGEGSFGNARRIEPYFLEQTDWRYVAAILEASRGEKLKMERSFIIRASKGARRLADVHENVKRFMADPKVRGLAADMYLCLDAYLDVVVPQIANTKWATGLDLRPGVNVVDLTDVPDEMQHLVIRSSLSWVLHREENCVVVIPEAWKFIPQGRGTPVKLAALELIRQGAALRNYVWLDSQDIGGIDKETLRSVPVWLLGVQREANEIKRTLENIPESVAKPKKADIATLDLGQFIACWKTHTIRTYVQPTWLDADYAQSVATGHTRIQEVIAAHVLEDGWPEEETTVTEREAQQLRDDNARLTRENDDLRRRLEALEKGQHVQGPDQLADLAGDPLRNVGARNRNVPPVSRPTHTGDRGKGPGTGPEGTGSATAPTRTFTPQETFDNEALYQAFKARLIEEAGNDPVILRLLVERPELRVEVQKRIVVAEGASTKGRVARLIAENFYSDTRRFSETLRELERTGTRINNKSLSIALQDLVVSGFLTKEGNDGYRAVGGMKVNIVEAA